LNHPGASRLKGGSGIDEADMPAKLRRKVRWQIIMKEFTFQIISDFSVGSIQWNAAMLENGSPADRLSAADQFFHLIGADLILSGGGEAVGMGWISALLKHDGSGNPKFFKSRHENGSDKPVDPPFAEMV
jgi:hypothetical protein